MYFTYVKVVILNLHPACEPNELAQAINKPSRAAIFARFINELARASSLAAHELTELEMPREPS